MFHLAAFYKSNLDTTADTIIPGLVDPALTFISTGSQYQLPVPMWLQAAYCNSPTLIRANIQSPTLRMVNTPYVRPVYQQAQARPSSRDMLSWYADQPFKVPALEAFSPYFTANPGTTEVAVALLWLSTSQSPDPIPPGQIITLRATASTAAVAYTWTQMSLTFAQQLPSGIYAIVGSEHISTTAIAHRMVFQNSVWRPGGLSHQANTDQNDFRLQTRRLGQYYTFRNTAPPLLEVLCSSTDASHEVYLQVIPLQVQDLLQAMAA